MKICVAGSARVGMLFNPPSEVESAHGLGLAGLLTRVSSIPGGLPRTRVPVAFKQIAQSLGAYSYGVATDSHRLPDTRLGSVYL